MIEHKLKGAERVPVTRDEALEATFSAFTSRGLRETIALEAAEHLIQSDMSGVESHGLVRAIQYARELENGLLDPRAELTIEALAPNRISVDAHGCLGISAMRRTVDAAAEAARAHGLSVATLVNAGHTGRLGAFAENAAQQNCLTIIFGGGDRERWRMVAPYGGMKAVLPTNPWCIGIPGGSRGPVVLDIATSEVAGGWIYAAREARVPLPDGKIIDAEGQPTNDPDAWFNGGAILPKGGPLGYGLALVAELVCDAMLGPVDKGEINWFVLAVNASNYRSAPALQKAAEEILSDIRACPPLPGTSSVSVPGERERDFLAAAQGAPLMLPRQVWEQIKSL